MVRLIRKIASLIGISTFFLLFFLSLAVSQEFTLQSLAVSLGRAVIGGSLFWVIGIVIADILLKGVVTDIDQDKKILMEGGLLQRVQTIQSDLVPGGADLPFSEVAVFKKTKERKQGKQS